METRDEMFQRVGHHYDTEGEHRPTGTRQAAHRAVAEGLLELPDIDPYEVLAEKMAGALRREYRKDEHGRKYRVNHAVRVTKGGVQYTFWATMGFAPHEHMEKAFGQRREQIIGDCLQLKIDVDVYNDMNLGTRPEIQLVLDFTDDVAERLEQHATSSSIELAQLV